MAQRTREKLTLCRVASGHLTVFHRREVWMDMPGLIWVVVKIMVLFWCTLNIRGRIIIGTQKGTIMLTSTHLGVNLRGRLSDFCLHLIGFCEDYRTCIPHLKTLNINPI